MNKNITKVERGFTLIELMAVMGIIAVLASVVFPGLADSRAKARDSERITEIGELAIGYELFYSVCKRYPVNGLNGTDDAGGACPGATTLADFIDPVPVDPVNAGLNVYTYGTDGTGSSYRVQAVLERNSKALENDSSAAHGIPCVDANLEYCKGR